MKKTTFSIVIPIFNSASFLSECIQSVLSQNYSEWELILVDDCSEDGSLLICQSFAKENDQIKIISIPHSGAGAARNMGSRIAKGDYILFLDADDYWRDINLLKKIDYQIRHRHADVVMFQMIQVTTEGKLILKSRKPTFPDYRNGYLVKEVFPELVRDGQVLASACNKCVNRQLLEQYNISFIEGMTAEDIDWVLNVFSHVRTIAFLDGEAYAYRQHHISGRASIHKNGAKNLAFVIRKWAQLLNDKTIPNKNAIAGMVAFEFGIYMGYSHQVSSHERKKMKRYQYLLNYGLDRKTILIYHFYKIFGYNFTCLAVRIYLLERKFR